MRPGIIMSLNLKELAQSVPNPEKRFGHTITMVTRERAILFGGAVGDGVYRITNDTYSFDCKANKWSLLKPKNSEEAPSPRAAHSSTALELNQMVIFGGAHSHGNLVDNELYLLKFGSTETNAKWIKVPIEGSKPSSRYGHSLVFFKPYILIIGGNIGNEPTNEVWSLSIEKSPFFWTKLEFKETEPSARVYQAVTIWKSPEQVDMVLMFGGRNNKNIAMNDLWGLRRHKSGVWDWVKAPMKNDKIPMERYQHSMICINSMVLLIGGRSNSNNEKNDVSLDVYNLENSEWFTFPGINRFRHVSWVYNNFLYTHGGFENTKPSVPTSLLTTLDLFELFGPIPTLTKFVEKLSVTGSTKMSIESNPELGNQNAFQNYKYKINENVLIAHIKDEKGLLQYIPINELHQEAMKIIDYAPQTPAQGENYIQNLYTTVLRYFMKPYDWKYVENAPFSLKPEIIMALCDEVIKILKKTPSLITLRPGVKIFGSIHGQFGDLMRFFKAYGIPDNDPAFEKKSDIEALDYLFLGNYVDRGRNSLEVICLLLALKLKFPEHINLLRGSHEDIKINSVEGLGYECETRLKEDINNPNSVFMKLNQVFEHLSFAAVIGKKILCVHSGIGINLEKLDQIEKLKRPFTINHNNLDSKEQKIVFDLLWSDPVLDTSETENKVNEIRENVAKGTLVRFGTARIQQFLADNELQIIIRSHECVIDGAEEFGNTNLYTIFSCTDYGGINNNDAAIFHYHRNTQKLTTLSIPLQKGFTKWYNLAIHKKSEAKRIAPGNITNEKSDPKDRPVTPPRRVTRK